MMMSIILSILSHWKKNDHKHSKLFIKNDLHVILSNPNSLLPRKRLPTSQPITID